MNRLTLADDLERFIGDQPGCDPHFFDDFTSTSAPSDLEPYRDRLRAMDPPLSAYERGEIRAMIKELRAAE